jgi:NAD(P)H-dependent FMN reductase
MATKPRIALIVSSTRPTRWADKPKEWILKHMQARTDIDVEVVDLRDFDLPMFDAVASNAYVPTQNPEAVRWNETVARFDGYVFLVAEYNRSITGPLKNAIDWDYVNWGRKPMGVVGYGSVGAARAIEQLRTISVELQMVPVRAGVHIGGSDFYRVGPYNPNAEPMEALDGVLGGSAKDMLDAVAWYARVLRDAKAAEGEKAAA